MVEFLGILVQYFIVFVVGLLDLFLELWVGVVAAVTLTVLPVVDEGAPFGS